MPHVVVAVNKIDLVDFSQEVYDRVESEVQAVARELGVVDAIAIPVSALDGDNVVERSPRTPWYDGPSLLELLEALPPSDDPANESFRLPVQLVIRPQGAARDEAHRDYRGYAGQVASGVVRVGDDVVALPSGRRTTVAGIDLGDRELQEAFAPQSVTLRLADEIDISRGDLIAAAADAPEPTQDIEAVVCWLGDAPLRPAQRLLLKHGSRTVQTAVRSLDGALDLDDLHTVPAEALVAQRHRPRDAPTGGAGPGRELLDLAPRRVVPAHRRARRTHRRRRHGGRDAAHGRRRPDAARG